MSFQFTNPRSGCLENIIFCFTGKSPKTRTEMEFIATEAGASVTKSITNKTNILVIADPHSMSSKAKKARKTEICMISPEQFFGMCKSGTVEGINSTVFVKKEPDYQFIVEKPVDEKGNSDPNRHSHIRRVQL